MTKKAEVIISDTAGKVIDSFYSKTLTKVLNSLATGTTVNFAIKENALAEQHVGNYLVRGTKGEPEEPEPPVVQPPIEPPVTPPVEPPVTPPTPEPTPAGLVYDSHLHSKLHDSKVRTFTKEGTIAPNGLGVECHASGSPKGVVNADGTFSLVCGAGHGRFYFFVLNYDARLEIEFAWWNEVAGQDCSLKMRSRHNEGGVESNRFGGYGFSIDRTSWDAKREDFHNVHSQAKSGSIPKIGTKEYHKVTLAVKDEGNTVVQIGTLDGKEVMKKVDTEPKPYMTAKASFAQQSYFWVRQNCDGNGEIRIKSLKIFKI